MTGDRYLLDTSGAIDMLKGVTKLTDHISATAVILISHIAIGELLLGVELS